MEMVSSQSLLVIGLAALVTYSLRLGGLLLASRLPDQGAVRRGLNALPGALLFALVLPNIIAEGVWGVVAAALIALVLLRTRNVFFAMLVGMGVIWMQRTFLG